MMKHLLCTFVCFILALTSARAQHEQDFASRYMSLYAEGTSLKCTTVSPLMMERMLKLPDVEGDDKAKQVLKQLKSIRLVHHTQADEMQQLYQKACDLAFRNPQRYKLYAEEADKKIYVRRHDGHIVEIVMFMHTDAFRLLSVTGNISEDFLQQVLKI